jgi:hypothetical protein
VQGDSSGRRRVCNIGTRRLDHCFSGASHVDAALQVSGDYLADWRRTDACLGTHEIEMVKATVGQKGIASRDARFYYSLVSRDGQQWDHKSNVILPQEKHRPVSDDLIGRRI